MSESKKRTTPKNDQKLGLSYHALADASRRSMLQRLSRGPASVSELARPLRISLPAVVQHVQVLENSGLIISEKIGRVRMCRIELNTLQRSEKWLTDRTAVFLKNTEK